MQEAAWIARLFGMDPVAVLSADRDTYQIRLAAAMAAADQMRQEG